jgi:hypothetical protein
MTKRILEVLDNPRNITLTVWISILTLVFASVIPAVFRFVDDAEQRALRERTDLERIIRAETSLLYQEGEITPRSIEAHLEPILNHSQHNFPQWAKLINYSLGDPKINCIYLNDVYREVYQVRENCFGKADLEIYSEATGETSLVALQEMVSEFARYDLLVAGQYHGFCLNAQERVYPWWNLEGGEVVDVIKCRYDFGDYILVIGTIPDQRERPEPEFPLVDAGMIKDPEIKVERKNG